MVPSPHPSQRRSPLRASRRRPPALRSCRSALAGLGLGLVLAVAHPACTREEPGPPPPAPLAVQPAAEGQALDALPEHSCSLSEASEGIEHWELRAADGPCTLLLPLVLEVGTLPVRIAGPEGTPGAALSWSRGDERYHADRGSVEITHFEGGILRGRVEAQDTVPPDRGALRATFELTLP